MTKKYRYPTFQLRMPPEIKEGLEKQAQENGRSLNAEIVWILEQNLTLKDGLPLSGNATDDNALIEIQALRKQLAMLDQKLTNGEWCESAILRVLKKVIRI